MTFKANKLLRAFALSLAPPNFGGGKLVRFFAFALALAGLAGAGLMLFPAPRGLTYLLAAVIVAVSAGVWRVRPTIWAVTPNPEAKPAVRPYEGLPQPNSRRWARALYHNGVISMEELVQFCASHPPVQGDPDNEL